LPGDPGSCLLGDRNRARGERACRRHIGERQSARPERSFMTWIDAAAELRKARVPAVLVTLAAVRGHAPSDAGAKLLVTAEAMHGTIDRSNLENTAVKRGRTMLAERIEEPEMLTLRLTEKATVKFGRQCCGEIVTMLFEPLPRSATVAIFGIGNIGFELTRIF